MERLLQILESCYADGDQRFLTRVLDICDPLELVLVNERAAAPNRYKPELYIPTIAVVCNAALAGTRFSWRNMVYSFDGEAMYESLVWTMSLLSIEGMLWFVVCANLLKHNPIGLFDAISQTGYGALTYCCIRFGVLYFGSTSAFLFWIVMSAALAQYNTRSLRRLIPRSCTHHIFWKFNSRDLIIAAWTLSRVLTPLFTQS